MTENDDRKDDDSVEDKKGEKSKIVRVASAVMMREMQIAENVQMNEKKKKDDAKEKRKERN